MCWKNTQDLIMCPIFPYMTVWRKQRAHIDHAILMLKWGSGSIMLWGYVATRRTWSE